MSKTKSPCRIMKNNTMEAVMLTFEEYKHLSDLDEMFEYFEIKAMIDERLADYTSSRNIDWNSIKE